MKAVKMSYKGFEFEVNPSSIEVSLAKNIETRKLAFRHSKTQETVFEPTVIKGRGRFCSDNAGEQAFELEKLFKSNGSAYLFAPWATPMKAFFKSLSLSTDSKDGSISYSFEFVEDIKEKKNEYAFNYVVAKYGDNLYTISNQTGVDVKTLFESNDYRNLFSVRKGDKVWLS